MVEFLAKRGLVLSPEKTRVTHIRKGFDFLGWNIRKYNGKLLMKPSKTNVKTHLDKTARAKNGLCSQNGDVEIGEEVTVFIRECLLMLTLLMRN